MKSKKIIKTNDLRETLKSIMLKEIKNLSEILETLEAKERIKIVIKLMPYVFPKVENIAHYIGEDPVFYDW